MHGSLVLRLGVCFVSFMVGSLADYQQNMGLYFVFTVLNACLGFLIFFFHCTCNETVRNWKLYHVYLAHVIKTTKFINFESPIFCLLAWSSSRARHSAIYTLKSRNLFEFFLNLKEALKCVLRIVIRSKQKFRCKYWGFGIRKFGCSMTLYYNNIY